MIWLDDYVHADCEPVRVGDEFEGGSPEGGRAAVTALDRGGVAYNHLHEGTSRRLCLSGWDWLDRFNARFPRRVACGLHRPRR